MDELRFRDVTLEDLALVRSYMQRYPTHQQNYLWEVLFLWGEGCEFQIAEWDGLLIIKTFVACNHNFLYPMGEGDVVAALREMIGYAHRRRCDFRLFQIRPEQKAFLEVHFAHELLYRDARNEYEYLYERERLATMAGKKLQSKRNHINFFTQNYQWSSVAISHEHLDEIAEFYLKWFDQMEESERDDITLQLEIQAFERLVRYWDQLDAKGILLRADNRIVAFAVGFPMNGDTFIEMFEKSNHEVRGASQMITKLFASECAAGYRWINRSEDAGDEGLRQAKLSYHPDRLEPVFWAKCARKR